MRRWTVIVTLALVALVVLAIFATPGPGGGPARPASEPSADGSVTKAGNDAERDYDSAMASGKPFYVLFHSLS